MKIIARHLISTIISSILLIMLILVGIEIFVTFIGELHNIGNGQYGVWQAFRYVLFDMPYQLLTLFPMAGLVGSLIGLGTLAGQSELIVMRASGYSTTQICFAVLTAACVMVVIVSIIGEVIAPVTEDMAINSRNYAKSSGQMVATKHGLWLRQGNEYMDIHNIVTEKKLGQVVAYDFDDQHQLKDTFVAKEAEFMNGKWYLKSVTESDIGDQQITSKYYPIKEWQVQFDPKVLGFAGSEPRNMTLPKLHNYIQYLQANGLHTRNYELAFWSRIIQPLATAVMIFLAVPFIFGPLRTVTMGLRIVTGVAVGFCFYILNQFFGPLSLLYQLSPILGAILPTLVFVGAGCFLIWRVR